MSFTPCTFTLNLEDVADASTFQDLFVRFELKNYGEVVPTVPGSFVLVPPFKDFYPSETNGLISGTIVGNDVISPLNTYYTISFYGNGSCFYRCDAVITGTSANLDNIRCLEADELPPGASCMCEYDIQIFFPGLQSVASQLLARLIFTRAVIFPANMLGGSASAAVAANAETIFTLNINGVEFGTITFAIGGTTGTIVSTVQTFAVGDILTVVGPVTPDIALANISISLLGNLG